MDKDSKGQRKRIDQGKNTMSNCPFTDLDHVLQYVRADVGCLLACLASQKYASVSQGRIGSAVCAAILR